MDLIVQECSPNKSARVETCNNLAASSQIKSIFTQLNTSVYTFLFPYFKMIKLFNLLFSYLAKLAIKFAWLGAFLSVGGIVYFGILIWSKRNNFEKLRKQFSEYPMPKLTNYLHGHLDQLSDRQTEWNWSKKFGKIYAFFNCDRLQVRTSDQTIINEIFLKQNRLFHSRVWHEYRLLIIFESILFNKGHKWKQSRKIFMPALTAYRGKTNDNSQAIRDLNVGIVKLIKLFRQLSDGLEDSPFGFDLGMKNDQETFKRKGFVCVEDESSPTGVSIDVRAYETMQLITLDVIFRLGFNLETIKVENGAEDPLLLMVKDWLQMVDLPLVKYALAIPFLRVVLILYVVLFSKTFRVYKKFMRGLMDATDEQDEKSSRSMSQQDDQEQEAKEESSSETDNHEGTSPNEPRRIYHVLKDEYNAKRITRREFNSQIIAVLIAGFETTATTSSYIIWCLAKHTDHQAKVSADISQNGIESKYLDMFIKETMRMYPALPNFVMRTPHKDTEVAGYKIKRGMSVYLGVNTVHYDESIWPNPHCFDPERFAEGKTYPPGAYVPFGLGHRMCAGYHLAMREMKIIVCEILSNFTIELIQPDEMAIESSTIFLTKSKHDIRVRLVPREAAASPPKGEDDEQHRETRL